MADSQSTQDMIVLDANAITESSFPVTKEEIKRLIDQYADISIDGVDDKEGEEHARKAQSQLRKTRIAIDNRRKELGAGALEFKRKVDAVGKELIEAVTPAEERIKAMRQAIEDERQRIKEERLQKRMDALAEVDAYMQPGVVDSLTDDAFAKLLADKTAERDAKIEAARIEAERIAKEEAERAEQQRIEQERIDRERAELEEQRKEMEAALQKQQEEQRKIEEERQRLAAIEAERVRQEELEQARIEAEQRAKEQLIREQQEAAEKADRERLAAEAEAKRIAAMQPDREKLIQYVDTLRDMFNAVDCDVSKKATGCLVDVTNIIDTALQQARKIVDEHFPKG